MKSLETLYGFSPSNRYSKTFENSSNYIPENNLASHEKKTGLVKSPFAVPRTWAERDKFFKKTHEIMYNGAIIGNASADVHAIQISGRNIKTTNQATREEQLLLAKVERRESLKGSFRRNSQEGMLPVAASKFGESRAKFDPRLIQSPTSLIKPPSRGQLGKGWAAGNSIAQKQSGLFDPNTKSTGFASAKFNFSTAKPCSNPFELFEEPDPKFRKTSGSSKFRTT
jgi:hypothetical protein